MKNDEMHIVKISRRLYILQFIVNLLNVIPTKINAVLIQAMNHSRQIVFIIRINADYCINDALLTFFAVGHY